MAAPEKAVISDLVGVTVAICTYRRPQSLARVLESLTHQEYLADRIVIVDASPDEESEEVARRYASSTGAVLTFLRVTGSLKGLTTQRNFAAAFVETDLLAYFDDDVVLHRRCLYVMQAVHREAGDAVAGVGAFDELGFTKPGLLWRMRRALRIVPKLVPGRYYLSGMSVPWGFSPNSTEVVVGDWLPGFGAMWKTSIVKRLGYERHFSGYCLAEDLEFSLRAGRFGKLVMAGGARLEHYHDPSGRPDSFRLGYMEIWNHLRIQKSVLHQRRWMYSFWFVYAWTMDTILLLRGFVGGDGASFTFRRLLGRAAGAISALAIFFNNQPPV